MKIYISPSEQENNIYAVGNGKITEEQQCHRIGDACKAALVRCGFDVKKAPFGQHMGQNISESNSWGADIHLCIHTNAGGGHGCIVFVSQTDAKHMKFAQPVYNAVSAITTANEKYGVRTANFAEIKQTNGMCVYCECEFHDNAKDAQWIIDNVENIGEALCKGLCEGAGVKYIAPAAKPVKNEKIYRVQVGAYSVKANADAMLAKVKAAGFKDAYIAVDSK